MLVRPDCKGFEDEMRGCRLVYTRSTNGICGFYDKNL
ncbi:hypothetical protein SAMN05216529_11645 [Faecalicatena contorta]|uniref:Uncharacterized protein n=1 Tax=Faecalicatena contorta TaxID=39482 RepID=A0A315ZS19_9FIRM|nr:hypothetical protein A8805_11645 [Faecalicatena contorta]SUQ15784.1 hypothetical protein SAMN05216529_11645 [Faecalicatena contorta]